MSQQKSEMLEPEAFPEQTVADYLRSHPDFFERHPALLMALRLPHKTGGAAISLVERQISMLRQRNDKLEHRLRDLVAVAKLNDALVEKIHQLSLKLMREPEFALRLELLETSLREDFLAERAVLVLFAEGTSARSRGFLKVVARDDAVLRPFSGFLKSARPRCGPMRERQKTLIFERDADAIGSAALIPLGESGRLGFLVIGSRDPEHFHPGKRMDFLTRLGELVAVALASNGEMVVERDRA